VLGYRRIASPISEDVKSDKSTRRKKRIKQSRPASRVATIFGGDSLSPDQNGFCIGDKKNADVRRVIAARIPSYLLGSAMPSPSPASLERYRPLLRLQARQLQLNPRLKRQLGSSDLVQDAYLRAVEKFDQFRGTSEGELVCWLQRILANIVKDKIAAAYAQERDFRRVRSLEQLVAESSVRLDKFVAAAHSSPSERAERNEMLVRLAAALDQLPEEQGDVIIHYYMHDRPVAEIAEDMGKTEKAVGDLLYRAKRRLRKPLEERA
jgi:RNA polymerase sigma-70 factor, ECF subfamily